MLTSLSEALIIIATVGQVAEYQKATFESGGRTLNYRLLAPAKLEPGTKYPLVLFLHGAGERGSDNQSQLKHGGSLFAKKENREAFPCFVVFPQCPANSRWVDADWSARESHQTPKEPSGPMDLTRRLVDQLLAKEPIDPDRVYVMGLSMGGYGTWDFAARYEGLVAAAVPICGGADHATAAKLRPVALWVFHGADDKTVWPIRSRSMVEALKNAGHPNLKYTEYPKVGHASWEPAFRESELLPWLFSQKRMAARP